MRRARRPGDRRGQGLGRPQRAPGPPVAARPAQRLNYVTNGLAYKRNAAGRPTLYATGKQWDYMYDIDVKATDLGPLHVVQHCDLYIPRGHAVGHL